MDHCEGFTGLNPAMQLQNSVDAVFTLHRPKAPHMA
jgi:hypothetical protein